MPGSMAQLLIAAGKRRPDLFDFHRAVPFRSRGNRSAMRTEADQIGLLAELLAAKLPDIVLATSSHFGRFGVPHMGVMRPDDGLAGRAVKRQQVLQGLEHVAIAQIPRRAGAI